MCNLIVRENCDRISGSEVARRSLKLQLYCMSLVTQRAIIGYREFMCYNYARAVTIPAQQERFRPQRSLDGRTKKKKLR